MEKEGNIHQRLLKLKDVALGTKRAVTVNSCLAPASYDCTVDSLLALFSECKGASSLAKDKNVLKFIDKYESTVSALNAIRVSADDFEAKSIIGRGHFGEVMLCEEKSTGDIFAMKVMKKAHILQQPDAAYYSAERDIMAWSDSPWLTSLHYAFQDSTSLYLIMDYHPGGDLLNIMERKEGSMQEDEARFYLAETAAGLNDLHKLGFVHRDVKPENVLISRSGHIKLVDFGSAARLDSNGKVIESQLPVGTPEYISPEVLTSLDKTADYGVCCDWWSLGIIAYELLYDSTPFEGDSTSKTYNNIMSYKKSLSFPDDSRNYEDARDLIKKLLTDMKTRLTYSEIQKHPFFTLTDWNHLLHATPPHIPSVSGPDDVSNFDVFEPLKDDGLKYPDLPSRSTGFVGKSLPFVGFTFSGTITSDDFADSLLSVEDEDGSREHKKALELVKKEAEEEKARRISLEKECVIYQSQLEDYHRKLEMEKSDRHVSDSRALQLLQEVKEKGKLAQQLREEQARTVEREYVVVVDQLEKERQEASRRSQSLQEKLKELQKERDSALKKAGEYKSKMAEGKEAARKEITNLQSKLSKLSKEFSAKVDEVRERYNESLAKKEQVEGDKRKAEMELKKLQTTSDNNSSTMQDLTRQLQSLKSTSETLRAKVDKLSKTNEYLEKHSASLEGQLQKMQEELDESHSQKKLLESEKFSLEQQYRTLGLQLEEGRVEREKLICNSEMTGKALAAKDVELQSIQQELSGLKDSHQSLEEKLKEAKALQKITNKTDAAKERLKASQKKVEELEKENKKLKGNMSAISADLKSKTKENSKLTAKMEETAKDHNEAMAALSTEVQELQEKLKEGKSFVLLEQDKLRESQKAKRELTRKNADLTTKLSMAEAESEKLAKQLSKSSQDLSKLKSVKDSLKLAEIKIKALQIDNDLAKKEMLVAQEEMRKMAMAKDEADQRSSLSNKQYEEQELTTALLQRNVKFLKEELKEVKSAAADAQKQQAHWKTVKETVETDLEISETKLDEACANVEKEKKTRQAAEQRMSQVAEEMQRLVSEHAEELEKLTNQLVMQKELSTKYSVRVLELEKEVRLKTLSHKETQKELSTEKAVTSKFYDEVQLKSRELNKLKATHMKLVKETQQLTAKIAQQEELLSQQRAVSERQQLQETRLQATISQQGKLIDYLQGVGRSPESKGLGRLKGLKLGRKGRDPAREIAEWNKLKLGISSSGKGQSKGVTQSGSSTSISTSAPSPSHTPSLHTSPITEPPSHTAPEDEGAPMELSTQQTIQHHTGLVTSTPIPTPRTTTSSDSTAGRKRKSSEVSGNTAANGKAFGQHNIPHKFRGLAKTGLRSNYICAGCKEPIKARHKFIKCSHCHTPCHIQCVDSLDQNCGLPAQLSSYVKQKEPQQPPQLSDLSNHSEKEPNSSQEQDIALPPTKKSKKKEPVHFAPPKTTPVESGAKPTVAVCERVPVLAEKQSKGKKRSRKGDVQLKKITSLTNESVEADSGEIVGGKKEKNLKKRSKVTEKSEKGKAGGSGAVFATPAVVAIREQEKVKVAVREQDEKVKMAQEEKIKMNWTADVKYSSYMKSIYGGFDSSKVIKMEKTLQLRGGLMTEGWLVLTSETLCLYDRDPRGVTRKPIHKFLLGDPAVAYVVLPSLTRQMFPQASASTIMNAFGLQVLNSSHSKELCFIAGSLQSKIEWVEAIQKVLTDHTCPPGHRGTKEPSPCTPKGGGARELKAVSIVPISTPIRTPQNQGGVSGHTLLVVSGGAGAGNESMELSIRSSMMGDSSGAGSDSSYI